MEEDKKSKNNKISTIIVVILCILIVAAICFELKNKLNTSIKTSTGFGYSDCGIYKYKNLKVNGKKVDFGLNKEVNVSNECWVSSVESYKQAKEFIVVKIYSEQWGYDGAGNYDIYYILNNDGKILMKLEKLYNNSIYDSKFSIEGNKIVIESYSEMEVPSIPAQNYENIEKYTYEIDYLGNGKFSEVKKLS